MAIRSGLAAAAVLFSAGAAAALPDFDLDRSERAAQPAPAARALPLGMLATHPDPLTALPSFVWAQAAEPLAEVGPLRDAQRNEALARAYLARYAQAWQLDAAMLVQAQVHDLHDTGRGAVIVRLQQRADGLEVFNRSLNVMLDRGGRLVAISGRFAPGAPAGPFTLTSAQALLRAMADLGVAGLAPALAQSRDGYEWFQPAAGLGRAPRAKRVWFPRGDALEPGYYVELFAASNAPGEPVAHSWVVSARDGTLLFRNNLVERAAFTYRVFADPSGIHQPYDSPLGNGLEPWPGRTPDDTFPRIDAGSQRVTLEHGPISTGDPWLPEGATETSGNNVDAYVDTMLPDGYQPEVPGFPVLIGNGTDLRAQATGPNTFDYPTVADADPTTAQAKASAAVTLFYVSNWLHDLLYDHGFDEEAGNGQRSNYGRGGIENDAVKSEGQDWSGRNNANMATPADGGAARMQMYLFSGPDSLDPGLPVGVTSPGDYDGTLDPLIIAHEYFHYVSNRLVGNGNGLNNNQGGSMGEGWSDVASLLIAVREEDRLVPGNERWQGTWSVGVYVDPNFYYSIRRQPYSTDFSKNSFTFRHIADGASAPTGAPTQGSGAGSAAVHDSGEIWANMMWECWAGLLNDPRHDFPTARDRFIGYLIGGLKMTPSSPTFVDARDGVLAAALAADPQDFLNCGRGFARRGIGQGAVAPASNSTDHAGVVESFEEFSVPEARAVRLDAAPAVADTARYGGAFGALLLAVLFIGPVRRRTSG